MRIVKVPLGNRSYVIHIGNHLLATLGNECRKLKLGGRCAVVTDSNVVKRHGARVLKALKAAGFDPVLITVPAGENSKRMAVVEQCHDQLASHRLERKSFIVALGGGVVGDLAGFVAATYLRGIPFVQAPTTLLAQVDSSVGGKTGVNLKAGKNLVGAFYQPRLVLCDLDTLKTLPEREYVSGLAEVVKYGIIYDPKLFGQIEKNTRQLLRRDSGVLADIVAQCCQIKADIVGQDETESGLRAILNFGHTIGHGIENSSGYGTYLHGEAISLGQAAAARLSRDLFGLSAGDVDRIERLLLQVGLPVRIKLSPASRKKIFTAMKLDKKVSGGEIKFVLAGKIGKVAWGKNVAAEAIDRVLEEVQPAAKLSVS